MADKVSIEMIYELLKEFKADSNRRFDQLERRMDLLEANQRNDRQKLEAIYDCRKQMTVRFTNAWMGASLGIAVFASFVTLLATKFVIL